MLFDDKVLFPPFRFQLYLLGFGHGHKAFCHICEKKRGTIKDPVEEHFSKWNFVIIFVKCFCKFQLYNRACKEDPLSHVTFLKMRECYFMEIVGPAQ